MSTPRQNRWAVLRTARRKFIDTQSLQLEGKTAPFLAQLKPWLDKSSHEGLTIGAVQDGHVQIDNNWSERHQAFC